MTIDGELRAIGAVARQMRAATRPPEPRRLISWASDLDTAVRGLQRGVRFLRETAGSPVMRPETAEEGSAGSDTPVPDPDAAQRRRARAAARLRELPSAGTPRGKILEAVAAVARDPRTAGLTDEQIRAVTGLNPNTVRPRRGELVTGGWLVDSGTTRSHHGTAHRVWVLTDRAAEVLAGSGPGT